MPFFTSWNIFILNILWSVLQVLKGVTCQAFSCALVQCHLTPGTAPVTFHLWKCELWPLEKWPLILTGPNGAWRTASDRRQMETQDACKDRRTCAGGHRDTLIERAGLGVQARGVTGEPRGRAQAGLGFHRKLLRHAGQVCFHVYWPSRHSKWRQAHALTTCTTANRTCDRVEAEFLHFLLKKV